MDDEKKSLFQCIIGCAWEIPTASWLMGMTGIVVHHIFMLDSLYGGCLGIATALLFLSSVGATYYIDQYLSESVRNFFDARWFGYALLVTAMLTMFLAYTDASLTQAALLDLFVFGLVVPSAFLTIMTMD